MDVCESQRLLRGAQALGVELVPAQVTAFDRYLEVLLRWNRRINLTAITEPGAVIERHFLDSLAVAPLLAPGSSLLDIGSGAGFPGAVVAIVRPDVAVSLCESVRKKAAFLRALATALRLDVEVVGLRSEELARAAPLRRFDAVVSRATLPLEAWVSQGAGFVGYRGALLAMVAEVPQALPRPRGFGPAEVHPYTLPSGSARAILRWRRE